MNPDDLNGSITSSALWAEKPKPALPAGGACVGLVASFGSLS